MNKESVLKQIRHHLENKGFNVFYPTQHEGECITEYLVISYTNAVKQEPVSTSGDIYDIMCYVPKNRYSRSMEIAAEVRETMKELFPLVRPTGYETPTFYDEEVNAHMVSIEYVNYRRILYR